jgi:hypothetical protein
LAQGLQQSKQRAMLQFAAPAAQVGALDISKLVGRGDPLDEGRKQDPLALGVAGFLPHEAARDGRCRPQDDDRSRRTQFVFDPFGPILTAGHLRIDKDRPSLRLQSLREAPGDGAVFARVADEDVAHLSAPWTSNFAYATLTVPSSRPLPARTAPRRPARASAARPSPQACR